MVTPSVILISCLSVKKNQNHLYLTEYLWFSERLSVSIDKNQLEKFQTGHMHRKIPAGKYPLKITFIFAMCQFFFL